MKVRANMTKWRAASGIVASFILMVSFQNCGKAGFDAESGADITASSDAALTAKYGQTNAQKIQGIPFAFDAGFDTISYNSCAESHLSDKSAFFSLKAGAYSSGGIKLKTEFFDYADQNFKPIYPETTLSENQYKEYLADSPANAGSVATMAIRVKNSLTDVYTTGSSVTLHKDVMPLVGTLTDSLVMDAFSRRGVTANYFPFSPEFRVMEANIDFKSSEVMAESFRNILMSSGILALTYMPNNAEEIYKVKAPSDAYPAKTAYGRGYNLTFSPYPIAGAAATNPNHVLAQLIETDLTNPSVGSKLWNCSRVYRIIRSQDSATLCPTMTYADIQANAAIRTELNLMRQHFRADQWDVNVKLRCMVPKNGLSCYKEENLASKGFAEVEYDLTKECYRPNGTYGGTVPTSKCMHFATLCTRD